MNTLKKVFAVLLTAALLFALTATAFADGAITVMDPGTETYTAYKIFDVTENNGDLSYTASDPWKTAIINAVNAGQVEGLQIDASTGVVTKLSNFKASEFAAWAKANIPNGAAATPLANLDGKMTTTTLDANDDPVLIDNGYYLVVPTNGDLASLCTVLDNEIAIQNKNDMPFDKKAEKGNDWVDESGVQIGDIVNFKITGKVPDTTGMDSYFYLVSDRLSEGLTLLNETIDGTTYTVTVTIDGTPVNMTVITDPNATLEGNQIRFITENGRLCGFDLSLDMLANGLTAGDDIEITYSALVNPNAASKISTNFATLDYGNETDQHHKESMTKHYCSTIVIDKYETDSPETKVPGAKFVLKNANDEFYAVDNDGNVSWVAAQADATEVVTDAEGAASFPGLPDGTYTLVETEAPAGYVALTAPITVTVDGSDSTAVGLEEPMIHLALTETVRVANTPGTNLPSFGGIGIYGIIGLGAALVVIATALILVLVFRKKQVD